MTQADQDQFAPHSICFGCGPANAEGLQIKSHWEGNPLEGGEFVMHFTPVEAHQAFPGVLNGGILGTLLDCHSNWAAATAIMTHHGWPAPECTVTADFHVQLKRPTPFPGALEVKARLVELMGDEKRMAKIEAEVWADTPKGRKITAVCTGHFVAVSEGHPAFHRWG